MDSSISNVYFKHDECHSFWPDDYDWHCMCISIH